MVTGESPARADIWQRFPGETRTGFYDQEEDDRFKAQPNWLEAVIIFEEADAKAPKIYNWEDESGFPNATVVEIARAGLPERTRNIIAEADEVLDEKIIDTLSLAQTAVHKIREARAKTGEFFGNKERGAFRKKVVTGVVIGALALTGTVTGLERDSDSGVAFHKAAEAGLALPAKTQRHQYQHVHTGPSAATTLQDGENPWTISEHQLEAHGVNDPTDTEVASYDKRLLRLNHIGPRMARYLHTGMKLLLPKIR